MSRAAVADRHDYHGDVDEEAPRIVREGAWWGASGDVHAIAAAIRAGEA